VNDDYETTPVIEKRIPRNIFLSVYFMRCEPLLQLCSQLKDETAISCK